MLQTWQVGEVAEVRLQPKGGGPAVVRGTVVIEDLTGVLSKIAQRGGSSGPQSPVTQFILFKAAELLALGLGQDTKPRSPYDDPVPKILSAHVRHEPFADSLGMSVNQMRRRWPSASAWYDDLVSYILRPGRYAANEADALKHVPEWMALPLGGFARAFAKHQLDATLDTSLFRLADAIEALWPDYPPVRVAAERYRESLRRSWGPLYTNLLAHYGLRLRPGVTLDDLVWIFNAMVTREGREHQLMTTWVSREAAAPSQDLELMTARVAMIFLAGAVEDAQDGRTLGVEALHVRAPRLNSSYLRDPFDGDSEDL